MAHSGLGGLAAWRRHIACGFPARIDFSRFAISQLVATLFSPPLRDLGDSSLFFRFKGRRVRDGSQKKTERGTKGAKERERAKRE